MNAKGIDRKTMRSFVSDALPSCRSRYATFPRLSSAFVAQQLLSALSIDSAARLNREGRRLLDEKREKDEHERTLDADAFLDRGRGRGLTFFFSSFSHPRL